MRLLTVALAAARHNDDEIFWQLSRTSVGAKPADAVVHSRFDRWLERSLDLVIASGDAATARRPDVAKLPRRPIIGLRADKHNATALCAFADPNDGAAAARRSRGACCLRDAAIAPSRGHFLMGAAVARAWS